MDEKDVAQKKIKASCVEPGQVFRHYKGGLYTVVAVGIDEATMKPMVAYCSNLRGDVWFRTLDNWQEPVEVETGPTIPRGLPRMGVPRFARVRE